MIFQGDLKRKGEILRSNGKDLTNQRDKMFTKLKEINDYIRRLTDAVKRNPITDEKKGKAKMENERLPKTGDEKNELATRENDKSSNEKTELENSKVVNGTDGKTQEELGLHEETVVTAESKEDKPINKKSNKQEEDNGNEEKNYSGNEKENDSGEERRYKTIMNAKLDENFLDGEETQASADEKKEEGRKEATVDGKQHEETNGMGESRDDARKIEKQSSGVNAKTGMKIVPKEDDKNRADDDSDDSSRRRKGQGESKTAEADKEGNVRKVKSETKNRKEKNDKESNAREEDGSSERQKGNRTREKNDGEVMKETMHNKANSKKDEKEERIVKGTEGNTLNVANAKGNIMASNLGINNLAPHQEALNTHAGEDLHGSNGNLVLEHNYIKVSKSSGHLDGLQTMNSYIDTSDNHNDLITNNHYHADRGNDDDDEEYVLQLTNYAKKQISSHGDLSEKALKNLIKVIKQRMLQDGFVKLQNATMVYKKSDEGENGKRISGNITRSEKPNESRRNKTKEMTSEMIGKGKINLYDKVVSNLMNAIKESTNDENEDSDKHNAIGDGKKESQIKADSSEENEQRKRMLSSLYLLSSEIENFKKVLRGAKKRDEGSVGGYKQTDRMEKGATKPSVEEMRFDNDVKKDEMKSTKNDENESKESEKKKSDNEEVNWGPDSARNDKNSHEKNENLESNVDKSISRESTQSRKDFQNAGDKKPKATTENNAKERKQTTRKSGDNKLINMEGGFKDITPKISFDENDENKTEPGDNESKEAFSKQLLVEGYANLVAGISDEGKVKSEKNGNSDEHNENAVDMSMNASKRNSYTDELAKTVEQYLKGVTVPGLLSDQANIDRRGNPTTEKELARYYNSSIIKPLFDMQISTFSPVISILRLV